MSDSSFSFGSFISGIIVTLVGVFFFDIKLPKKQLPSNIASDKIPKWGVGKYSVYVEYLSKGGVDHHFPTVAKRDAFRKEMNNRYNSDDPEIIKVR